MERFPRNPFFEKVFFQTPPFTSAVRRKLQKSYNEPWKTYHNTSHLTKLWSYYNALFYNEPFEGKMYLTILFHDCIYEIGNPDNEELSAQEFEKFAEDQKLTGYEDVATVIRATKGHCNPENAKLPEWGKIFLDLDLYELGSSEDVFQQNSDKIFSEFSHKFSKDEIYSGRKKWLEKMLYETDSIFWIFKNRNSQAAQNIREELNMISLLDISLQ